MEIWNLSRKKEKFNMLNDIQDKYDEGIVMI